MLSCRTYLSLVTDIFVNHISESSGSFQQLDRIVQFIQRPLHPHPQAQDNTGIKQVTYLAEPTQLLGPSDIHCKTKTQFTGMFGLDLQDIDKNISIVWILLR